MLLRKLLPAIFLFSFVSILFIIPLHTFAHEVYVLSPQEVSEAMSEPVVSPLTVAGDNTVQLLLWSFGGLLVLLIIFFASISERLEKWCSPFLMRLKPFAPIIGRVTIGLSFIAAAYYGASYGPELPLVGTYGHYAPIIIGVLYIIGICITIGLWTRLAAAVALVMYCIAVYYKGTYMLTYINYLGEIILLLTIGAGGYAVQKSKAWKLDFKKIEQYGFLILRVLFGVALIYASAYAKIIHANLGLDTVLKYHLTAYFPFEPHFLVLGAALTEMTIGMFFILGIQIRFTAVFLMCFLTASLLFFGEVVWPHIILIGTPIALFCHGYDKYSLEGYFFKKRGREPVL